MLYVRLRVAAVVDFELYLTSKWLNIFPLYESTIVATIKGNTNINSEPLSS